MDVFNALEDRITRLIDSHRELQQRVATLEGEIEAYREGSTGLDTLRERVATLEAERDEGRGRLVKLLATLQELEL